MSAACSRARGALQGANAAGPRRQAALTGAAVPRPARQVRRQLHCVAAAAAPGQQGVRLAGCGSSVPARFLTNEDLAQLVDTNDEWITSRTGIKKRHILSEGETLGGHAAAAARRALEMAGVRPEDVDLVVLATSSPDDIFGSATTVQVCCGCRMWEGLPLACWCSSAVAGKLPECMQRASLLLPGGSSGSSWLVGRHCWRRPQPAAASVPLPPVPPPSCAR